VGDPFTYLHNGSSIFEPNLFPYYNPTFLKPSSFYTQLPAYEDGTECSETSAYKLETPENYPEESIQPTFTFEIIIHLYNEFALLINFL